MRDEENEFFVFLKPGLTLLNVLAMVVRHYCMVLYVSSSFSTSSSWKQVETSIKQGLYIGKKKTTVNETVQS